MSAFNNFMNMFSSARQLMGQQPAQMTQQAQQVQAPRMDPNKQAEMDLAKFALTSMINRSAKHPSQRIPGEPTSGLAYLDAGGPQRQSVQDRMGRMEQEQGALRQQGLDEFRGRLQFGADTGSLPGQAPAQGSVNEFFSPQGTVRTLNAPGATGFSTPAGMNFNSQSGGELTDAFGSLGRMQNGMSGNGTATDMNRKDAFGNAMQNDVSALTQMFGGTQAQQPRPDQDYFRAAYQNALDPGVRPEVIEEGIVPSSAPAPSAPAAAPPVAPSTPSPINDVFARFGGIGKDVNYQDDVDIFGNAGQPQVPSLEQMFGGNSDASLLDSLNSAKSQGNQQALVDYIMKILQRRSAMNSAPFLIGG